MIKRLYQFLDRPLKKLFIYSFFTGIGLAVIEYFFAYTLNSFIQFIVSGNNTPHSQNVDFSSLYKILTIILILAAFRSFLLWLQYSIEGMTQQRMNHLIRKRVLHFSFYSQNKSGIQAAFTFHDQSHEASVSLLNLQSSILHFSLMLFLAISLFSISPQLTIFSLSVLFIIFLIIKNINYHVNKLSEKIAIQNHSTHHTLLQSIKNILLLEIYGQKENLHFKLSNKLDETLKDYSKFFKFSGIKFSLPPFIGLVIVCLSTWMTFRIENLNSTFLISYFYLFVRFTEVLIKLTKSTSFFSLHKVQLNNVIEWWINEQNQNEFKINKIQYKTTSPFLEPIGWEIQNIFYGYSKNSKFIFNNFSFHIHPGDFLWISGSNGSGKSTFIQLLLGNIQPLDGKISILHRKSNLSLIENKFKLLTSIGYVGPDPFIIEGSILENLYFGLDFQPDELTIHRLLSDLEIDFIENLNLKLHHPLSEIGTGLSTGQKHLIAFVRALLRNPQVLILDESTAFLDPLTELKIKKALIRYKKNKTIILISHDTSFQSISNRQLNLSQLDLNPKLHANLLQ